MERCFILFYFGGKVVIEEGKYEGDKETSETGVHDVKFLKNQQKVFKKKKRKEN